MVCVVCSGDERIYYSYMYNVMENIQPMKWIGIARIYDRKTGHFQCRRRVYVRTEHKTDGTYNSLYVLRFSKEDGYIYRRIDGDTYNVEFL